MTDSKLIQSKLINKKCIICKIVFIPKKRSSSMCSRVCQIKYSSRYYHQNKNNKFIFREK